MTEGAAPGRPSASTPTEQWLAKISDQLGQLLSKPEPPQAGIVTVQEPAEDIIGTVQEPRPRPGKKK